MHAGAQPLQHSPTLTPTKASPPAAPGATPGCPALRLLGFPWLHQAFCPRRGTARAFPRHPEQLQGCMPVLQGCVSALRGPWALCSPGKAQMGGAGGDMSPGLPQPSFPPAFWQGAGSRAWTPPEVPRGSSCSKTTLLALFWLYSGFILLPSWARETLPRHSPRHGANPLPIALHRGLGRWRQSQCPCPCMG